MLKEFRANFRLQQFFYPSCADTYNKSVVNVYHGVITSLGHSYGSYKFSLHYLGTKKLRRKKLKTKIVPRYNSLPYKQKNVKFSERKKYISLRRVCRLMEELRKIIIIMWSRSHELSSGDGKRRLEAFKMWILGE